ncbi:ferric reductase like transmembrane component-domain-containing protein [Daldinia caldariorum]|uniref:ferric reductase like transmembrane component-domain-containing protein n=1 Tax=Daldinia caldariorum TaxID=326644 RepID=UPI002008AD8F|nr:ferric reductase like transmembrane component-domain-containing protein [Daldinia caldariorum]KAI1472559.1 ferric reductase like transmembrane component-domain-containing protein [Daldinia caldariorum]
MALIDRRRVTAFGSLTPAAILALRDSNTSDKPTGTDTDSAASNIGQFSTSLNGVDQPSNLLFKDMLWWTLGIIALIVLAIRLIEIGWTKLRHVSAMATPGEKQTYWKRSQWSWMPWMKRNLIYAPLWKKRHNREIKISSAISIGTLPSRLHSVILGVYLISNLVYLCHVDWYQENRYALAAEIRGRSGMLSLVNMVPLIIMAGRNNPLIAMLRVSFDTYNLLHRWMGRMVVIEAVIHTIAWAVVAAAADGYDGMNFRLVHDPFLASGFAGTIALVILLFFSISPVRHAFYETFLTFHIVLAFIIFAMTWVHCATATLPGGLPQLPWVIAIFILWGAERLARMFRLAYNNWAKGKGFTEAVVEPLPGETTRVTMHLPRHVDIQPGTHAYVRFMGINPWENHPFSIAWVEHQPEADATTVEKSDSESRRRGATSVSFLIGAHTGFTRKLYEKALKAGSPSIRVRAALEGPYAGHHSLDSYGHAVLFAGSTGITHQISYLKPLIEGFDEGTIATRRVTLVWIIRDTESLTWVRPWMDEILRMPRRREILNVRLFVTRPKNTKEIISASSTVQMFPGRPNILTLLKKEVEEQVGAMCVTVCGPGSLADDVRQAVRSVQDESSVVDFVEESFTW